LRGGEAPVAIFVNGDCFGASRLAMTA